MNIEKISVDVTSTLADAMQVLDKEALQIVLVTDGNTRLLGTVTDGDIRRGLLNGVALNAPIDKVMRHSPITTKKGTSKEEVLSILSLNKIHHLPIVNENGILVGLELLDDMFHSNKKDNLVVLMAGGMGRRLGDLTKNIPKPLIKVGTRPILETILSRFIKQGYWKYLISVNYKSDMIENYFGDGSAWGVEIGYLRESQRLGTAGALSLISQKPDRPFFVMNGDLLTNINFDSMLKFHAKYKSYATMGVREYDLQIPYGVVYTNEEKITNIVEKPIQRFFVNSGIYILEPDVIDFIPEACFFDMPNLFKELLGVKKNITSFPVHEYWMDIGRASELEKAQNEFSENFSEHDN